MCFKKKYKEYSISASDMAEKLEPLGLKQRYLWDRKFYYVSHEDWGEIFRDVLMNMPKYTSDKFDCAVAEDLAYVMGFFFADGTCGLTKAKYFRASRWNLCNTNVSLLERCIPVLEREWPELTFRVESYPSESKGKMTNLGERNHSLYHLQLHVKNRHNNGVRGDFIKEWHQMFYENGYKKVPPPILESDIHSKRAFLRGVIDGDGCKSNQLINVNGDIGAYGLGKLMSDIGWEPSRYLEKRRPGNYVMRYGLEKQHDAFVLDYLKANGAVRARRIRELFKLKPGELPRITKRLSASGFITRQELPGGDRKLIFQKEWPNGCEDFALLATSRVLEKYKINTCGIAIGQGPHGYHGFNIFMSDVGLFYLEPQSGMIYSIEEDSGYKAEIVIMG